MATISLREQIVRALESLSEDQQEQVLDYVHTLRGTPPGTPGQVLIDHMRRFDFAPEDIAEMMQAIEEGCERIDWDDWQ